MADVQKTYSLVALGFSVALFAGVSVWPPIMSNIQSLIGWVGALLVALFAFVPLFLANARPSLLTYLLFAVITEGYVLSIVPAYAQSLGPIAWGVVAGGALAFALIGFTFSERELGEGIDKAALAMIFIAFIGSLAVTASGFLGVYSWHLDLFATGAGFVGFLLFAAYDASKVRQYPDEYRAAMNLLIDLVGMIVELLRLVWLLQNREE